MKDDLTDYVEDEDCWLCGGSGVLDDECTCMDDTCCCLEPTPPECPECALRYRERRAQGLDIVPQGTPRCPDTSDLFEETERG